MFLIDKSYYLVKKTKHKGRGVFAAKDIEAGVIIGDYLGKIIDDSKLNYYENKYGFYSMSYVADVSIFPDLKKPGIYLVNHSCTPNCEGLSHKNHMLYFSLRKIFKGEELTVNYAFAPEDDFDSVDICKCGSPACKATIYCTEEKMDKWNDFVLAYDKKHGSSPRVRRGENLPPLKKYPAKIPDYQIFNVFGNIEKKPLMCPDKKLPSKTILRLLIRNSGRCLNFVKINLCIYGIMDDMIVSCPLKK